MRFTSAFQTLKADRAGFLVLLCTLLFFITGGIYVLGGPLFNPSGDEPHFLVISQTILKYHSLNVLADYRNGDYRSFYFDVNLSPHITFNARHETLPLHSIGGPLLWLIPFLFLGRLGAVWFIAALSVFIVWNIYKLLLTMGLQERTAFTVSLIYAFASPIYIYSYRTFIEPIGALVCIYVFRKIVERDTQLLALVMSSLLLGLLPWVHIRFAFLEIILFFTYFYQVFQDYRLRHLSRYLAFLLPIAALMLAFEFYNFVVWGNLNPAANQLYGNSTLFEVWPYKGLLGLLFDQDYGLLICFPFCLFLLAGIILTAHKRYHAYNLLTLALSVPYVIAFTTFRHWGGGWSPPARFILVLLPIYAFYLAYAIERIQHCHITKLFVRMTFCWGLLYNLLSLLPPYNGFSNEVGQNQTLWFLQINGYHLTNIWPSVKQINPLLFTIWIGLYLAVSLLFVSWAKVAPMRSESKSTLSILPKGK